MFDLSDEYRIIRDGAGWIERPGRGRLRLDGRDVPSFLQALVTNDVLGLPPGAGRYTTYLTPTGRMLADMEIFHRPDGWILGLAAGRAGAVAERLDQSIFSEDVRVRDVSAELVEVFVAGGRAAERTASALSLPVDRIAELSELGQADWQDGFVAALGEARLPTFAVIAPVARRGEIVDRLRDAGMSGVTPALVEALRIDAGRPRFGADLSEDTIPLEAGLLERAISTTKGCYVGQEIIIRILHRGGGRVARRLVTLAFARPAGGIPPAGTALVDGDTSIGALTSVSPALDGPGVIALGYVHRALAEAGREVAVGDTGARARVTGLAG